MEDVLLILCIIIMMIAVAAMAVVITLFMTDRRDGARANVIYSPQMPVRGTETSYARMWEIQLWDMNTNQIYAKQFSSQVMLGRYIPGTELFWQMRLGSDPTISREQCVIYDRGGFLVIENISKVNPTMLDGQLIQTPIMFQQGSMLTMGNNRYLVSSVRRIA